MLPALSDIGVDATVSPPPASGYGWSRWWRRGYNGNSLSPLDGERRKSTPGHTDETNEFLPLRASPLVQSPAEKNQPVPEKQYAKTLRLSSNQLVSSRNLVETRLTLKI